MKKHIITEKEYEAVKILSKKNKHKRVEKRLQVIILRYEGKKDHEIAEKLGYSCKRVSQLCAEFKEKGFQEYVRHKYRGNHQSISVKKEQEIAGAPTTVQLSLTFHNIRVIPATTGARRLRFNFMPDKTPTFPILSAFLLWPRR